MLQYRTPGVYLQEASSGVHSIVGATTSVALFVGPTLTGIDGRRTRIENFGDFTRLFGGLSATSNLSYSVLHFFANGGGEAWVVRVPSAGSSQASIALKSNGASGMGLTVTALGSGASGNNLYLDIDPFDLGAKPFGGAAWDATKFNLVVTDAVSGNSESWGSLSTAGTDTRYAETVVDDTGSGSGLVEVTVGPATGSPAAPAVIPTPTGSTYSFTLPNKTAFLKPVRVIARVTPLATNGSDGTAIDVELVVFAKDELYPKTPQEFRARVAAAINSAVRQAQNPTLAGQEFDFGLFESGTLLRVRLGAQPLAAPATRINDATAEIIEKTKNGTYDSLVDLFSIALKSKNVSRYQLGNTYASALQFAAPVVGIDGNPAGQPSDTDFLAAIQALETPDPFFNTLCLPDLVRGQAANPRTPMHANAMACYSEAARICGLKHALLLVDPFPGIDTINAAENWKSTAFTFASTFAAVFFPNIRVDDPLISGAIRAHPPSGAIAGVIARTDANVGVWQAPAGTEAYLAGAYGPTYVASDAEHGVLNVLGVNVIRQFPIFNTVNFGSRTLDGEDARASEWKYLPVRRTANYILQSLGDGLKWAVHQPNGEALWMQLRMNVNAFMQTLFRQGAFKGTSASEAYFVKCDAETTTAADINNGIVNIVVGFAPLRPAEFVVVTLRQIVQANQ